MIKVVYDHDRKMTWAIRLVLQGQSYGRADSCVHRGDTPLVEFFDTRFEFSDLGQFVSRYHADTLLAAPEGAFCLDDGIPDWNLSAGTMGRVRKWVANKLRLLTHPQVSADEALEV